MVTYMGMPEWRKDYQDNYQNIDYPSYNMPGNSSPFCPDVETERDVAFNRHSLNDGKHISPYDQGYIYIGQENMFVRLVQGIDEKNFKHVLSRSIRATSGIAPGDDFNDDWEEMLQGGLQTALESQVLVFEVTGASRAVTHQLVRSRRAAFHQQSQRATWYGLAPNFRMPKPIADDRLKREAWIAALEACVTAYNLACDDDVSYENARYILPEGITNYILCEYSVREFMNFFAYRGCSMFMGEMVHIARSMRKALIAQHPWIGSYVKITCEKTKVCEFQGWEKVEGQCDFPWAKEENRRFKSKRYSIGK